MDVSLIEPIATFRILFLIRLREKNNNWNWRPNELIQLTQKKKNPLISAFVVALSVIFV